MINETFLSLNGYVNDLLMVNEKETMKCTRLINFANNDYPDLKDEIVDVCITSTNMYGDHPLFDNLLGKKINITVTILDE